MIMKTHQLSNDSIYRKKVDKSSYKNIHSFLDLIDDEKNQHITQYIGPTKILLTVSYIPDRVVFHKILHGELDFIIQYHKILHHCRFSQKALHYILHHYKKVHQLITVTYSTKVHVPLLMLPEKVIIYEYEKHQYGFPWNTFSIHYDLTPEFMIKYKDKIDCMTFLIHRNINPDIIHLYEIDWNYISHWMLPENYFLDKYKKYLNWLILAPKLNMRQIQRYSDYMVDMYG